MSDSAEDFEKAWAQIVADLSADLPADLAELPELVDPPSDPAPDSALGSSADSSRPSDGPDRPESDGPAQPIPPPLPPSGAAPGAAPHPSGTPQSDARPGFATPSRSDEPPAPPDPGAFVDKWEDEGHYHPPPPPELPTGTPIKRLAWAGLIGGPVTLLLSALTPWNPPPIVALGAGLATLAGFATLVWQLPESREDGWDDGARI